MSVCLSGLGSEEAQFFQPIIKIEVYSFLFCKNQATKSRSVKRWVCDFFQPLIKIEVYFFLFCKYQATKGRNVKRWECDFLLKETTDFYLCSFISYMSIYSIYILYFCLTSRLDIKYLCKVKKVSYFFIKSFSLLLCFL